MQVNLKFIFVATVAIGFGLMKHCGNIDREFRSLSRNNRALMRCVNGRKNNQLETDMGAELGLNRRTGCDRVGVDGGTSE